MRTFNLDLETARKICKKFSLSKPKKVKKLKEGMINDVFSIDKKYVIKINTGHPEIPKLEREKEIYNLVNDKVPTPEIYGFDSSKEILSYSYILMEYIKGSSLGSNAEFFKKREKKWLPELGKILALIHSFKFDHFWEDSPRESVKENLRFKNYFKKNINLICEKLKESREVDDNELLKIKKYYFSNSLFSISPKASLIHGNFIPSNVIVEGENIKAVVDWEWAKSGHHEEEVATFLYRNLKLDEELVKLFREGYEEIIPLPSEFEQRLYAYNLLYYLSVLPEVPKWTHRPDKQEEYREEVKKLLKIVIR